MKIISYSNITDISILGGTSRFTGSSLWRHDGNMFYIKKRRNIGIEIKGNIYNNYLQSMRYCEMLELTQIEKQNGTADKKITNFSNYLNEYYELRNFYDSKFPGRTRIYKINKAKVRKRIISLCRLKVSRKFLAFYSVSFPVNASDGVIYEIFNKWLTNCRKRYGLHTYVWVAERQKNGTLHFHILTNNRMDISLVNKAMANSIETSVNQEKLTWGQSSRTLYNGVDVDSITHPKKRQKENREQYRRRLAEMKKHTIKERTKFAMSYMTKYMTKTDEVFTHYAFHSSRNISQLFTSFILSDNDFEQYKQYLSDDFEDYIIIGDQNKTVYIFKKIQTDKLYNMLDRLNDLLYEIYQKDHSPP